MQNNKTKKSIQNTKSPLNLPTIQITNSCNNRDINQNNIKLNDQKSHFVRRVSFDNYDPDSNSAHINDSNNKNNNTANKAQNSDNTANNFVKPTSILKNSNNDNSAPLNDIDNIRDLSYISANNDKQPLTLINNNNNNNPVKSNPLSISSTSSALPIRSSSSISSSSSLSSSPTSPNSVSPNNKLNSNNKNVSSINNNSLQFTNPFNNNRKKSYNEMSDSELLALDNQFNVRSVDIEKSYGFNVTPRLSVGSISNCDKNSLNSNNTNFKNLSTNAMLNEYPTKPIITKNSICFNFKNSNLKNIELNGKFYLILLSNESSSLSSLNYYINNISSKGDTIVICCSLSTSILGNDKNDLLNDFIKSFTNLILHHLDLNLIYPISITFEFFKTGKFFNEVLNLYQPSLIIVGTNNEKTKSTSLTTIDKKLLSIVYVGNDNNNNNNNNNTKINFKIPNYSNNKNSNNDMNNLVKTQTNDTVNSSLFENLNGTPNLDLSKSYSNSTSYSNEFLKPTDSNNTNSNSNLINTNQPTQRRRSMLDVLDQDTKNKLSRYSSNDSNCAIDDSSDLNIPSELNKLSINSNYELHKLPSRGSNASSDTPKLLSEHEKQKQELFEKYQKRLSAVKVGPQTTSNTISTNKSKSLGQESKIKKSSSDSKSFLKKWFK